MRAGIVANRKLDWVLERGHEVFERYTIVNGRDVFEADHKVDAHSSRLGPPTGTTADLAATRL